jgi:CRISPR-associated endonuclease/helicase Cas3
VTKNSTEHRLERLQRLESLLLAHAEGLTQAEIARHLGVHRSTVMRDLAQANLPVTENERRLWIDRSSYLVHVRFTLHEALAVHLAARLLASRMDRQNPHAAAALRKLGLSMDHLAPRISSHLTLSADVMEDQSHQRQDPVYLDVLEKLTLAWAELRKAEIWHRKPEGTISTSILSPYFIEPNAIGQSTYVIGWREPPGALRTFKVERIERVTLLQEKYEIPAEFDPRRLLEDAWGIWFTEQEPVEVVLQFAPRVTHRVGETRWHRSEQVTQLDDGSLLWRAWVAEPREMLPWIRGWGADVEVVEPESLRKVILDDVMASARLYGCIG